MSGSLADDLIASITTEIAAGLEQARAFIEDALIASEPNDSGDLRTSTHADPWVQNGNLFTCRVHADSDHAKYVDEGTGIYAGHDRITSSSGGPLVFYWKKTGMTMFRHSVKGMPAQPFFATKIDELTTRALEASL